MRRKILATALLLPVLGFSYELNFNKNFSKVVNPDLLTSSINISIEKKDEKSVNSEMEKFNKFIKENKTVTIKNANYTLSPKYEYLKDKTEFKGYIGNSRFTIESKDAQKINDFLNNFVSLKDSSKADNLKTNSPKTDDLKINISNLSWTISDELEDQNLDELRLESLIWIEKYAKELSSKIVKKCEVKSVNVNESMGGMVPKARMMSLSMESASSDIAPLNSEQTLSINTNFILDCK